MYLDTPGMGIKELERNPYTNKFVSLKQRKNKNLILFFKSKLKSKLYNSMEMQISHIPKFYNFDTNKINNLVDDMYNFYDEKNQLDMLDGSVEWLCKKFLHKSY